MLEDLDLHVWRATLDFPETTVERMGHILSSDEETRANRFHFRIDHDRFVSARACLRIILSRYISVHPSEIQFSYAAHGKPSVTNDAAVATGLKFNLAHSGGRALYAIGRQIEIGVDLEQIRAEFLAEDIAERFFSATEVARLRSLPTSQQTRAFFNCWTRKEAFIKAKGTGLSQALDQFAVTLGPDEPAILLETRWDRNEAARWSLRSINLGADFAAAVAFDGGDRQIFYWDFDERMSPDS